MSASDTWSYTSTKLQISFLRGQNPRPSCWQPSPFLLSLLAPQNIKYIKSNNGWWSLAVLYKTTFHAPETQRTQLPDTKPIYKIKWSVFTLYLTFFQTANKMLDTMNKTLKNEIGERNSLTSPALLASTSQEISCLGLDICYSMLAKNSPESQYIMHLLSYASYMAKWHYVADLYIRHDKAMLCWLTETQMGQVWAKVPLHPTNSL